MSAMLPGDRPVDIELLADFSEGLLPAAEASAVQTLVDGDPEWADALALLRESAPDVSDSLAAYADDTSAPMPSDVMDRLSAALTAERSSGDPEAVPRRGPTRPSSRHDASRPTTPRARGRRYRAALGALTAVVVLVAVGIGFGVKFAGAPSEKSSGTTSDAAAQPPLHTFSLRGVTITASGTNYTALSITAVAPSAPGGLTPAPGGIKSPAGINAGSGVAPAPALTDVPPALRRLLNPDTLRTCLTKIEGLQTGTARQVDFATYDGSPAIIVTLESPNSMVAADPDCDPMSPVTTSHS